MASPTNGQNFGTIVLLPGFGGTDAIESPGQEDSYVAKYTGQGYYAVQMAWGDTGGIPWEQANYLPNSMNPANVRSAACRPATFLHWVRFGDANHPPIWKDNGNPGTAGMCAHGFSAGAGAAAFATAWYGAADPATGVGYLDKLELLSGPELADIKQGCQINSSGVNAQYTTICPNGQLGCRGWPVPIEPGYHLEFSPDAANSVNAWTGNPSPACANNTTQTQYDDNWLHMSIVDLSGSPSFTYPKTAISAWLCQSVTGATANNSEAQGQIFYEQFTSSSQFLNLTVNAIENCLNNPENVNGGTFTFNGNTQGGFDAIWQDMALNAGKCIKNPGH